MEPPCEMGVGVPCALMSAGSEEDMVALAPGDEELEKVLLLRMAESSQGGFRDSVARVLLLVDEF